MPDEVKKKDTLVISKEKEEKWLRRESECNRSMYNKLQGQLLTTVEIALSPGNQLEALKSRIRDIQGEMQDMIDQTGYTIFEKHFTISDEPRSEKPGEEEYSVKVNEFWHELCGLIKGNFDSFNKRIVNLTVLAMEGVTRQQVMETEIQKLIYHASYKLQGWLRDGITEAFGVK